MKTRGLAFGAAVLLLGYGMAIRAELKSADESRKPAAFMGVPWRATKQDVIKILHLSEESDCFQASGSEACIAPLSAGQRGNGCAGASAAEPLHGRHARRGTRSRSEHEVRRRFAETGFAERCTAVISWHDECRGMGLR